VSLIKRVARTAFAALPARNRYLYEFCARYVDRFNGDNNSDPDTNGEYAFLRTALGGRGPCVVFDVGANVGEWTSRVLGVNPRAQVHCFEPSRTTYDRLAAREWPANVRLNNIGLGDKQESLDLQVVADGSAMNSLYLRRGIEAAAAGRTETIAIDTVDAYCERNGISSITFMKVDVEGHELAVFKGMSRALRSGTVRMIQFEYGGCNLDSRTFLADIWDCLIPHGFVLHKVYSDGLRRVDSYRQSLETFRYSNWVAMREAP
jgi:FkbM family methyltransferase